LADAYAIPLDELGIGDVARVGGKCASLGELTGAGFPVPPGFAVSTRAFEEATAPLDLTDVQAAREAVRGASVPDAVAAAIRDAYAALAERVGASEPPVAVRSSAVAEDSAEGSFAGLQDTYLWLNGADAVLDGVRRCWASYFNAEALAYRENTGAAAEGMAVAVQYMVDARAAGVMFTLNPVSGDQSTIAIDAAWGLGEGVVSGEVTPDHILYSKVTRELVKADVGDKAKECLADPEAGGTRMADVEDERRTRLCLEEDQVAALAELADRALKHYGAHQDLEWAIDRDGELFLLQSRPETVWNRKERERIADPNASMIDRIGSLYTGKR
jgi:phosphoenolpyruvate synthase/pyruvate phosphate dikinase